MKVGALRDLIADADDDLEVRFIGQPERHALEYKVSTGEHYLFTDSCPNGAIVLVEGSQVGYWSEPEG